ncbi:MAG: tetratricopeptide repeat protein [Polyangiaceae bacterium]|nr:tetratricopeptide repeat protein [Polyangiaceae bacterium]
MTVLPEIRVARFAIDGLAARGGMGAIYKARDRARGGATVALKVLAPLPEEGRTTPRATSQKTARFIEEARVLSSLDHPAIVKSVDFGFTEDNVPYLAMEWLEGETLAQRLLRAPLSDRETAHLGVRTASALAYAHARGVLHRDVKPENLILVGGDAQKTTLVDFGIAHVEADRLSEAETGRSRVIVGTPGYMAPEQARGAPLNHTADVFSLGCVLFECVARRPAFVSEHFVALLAKVLVEDVPHLDRLIADVPLPLSDVVARMLDKAPEERPAAEYVACFLSELLPRFSPAARSALVRPLDVYPGDAPTLQFEEQPPPSALSEEQHFLSLFVASPAKRTTGRRAGDSRTVRRPAADLLRSLARPGLRVEAMRDGSIVGVVRSSGDGASENAAQDHAALAVRAAFAVLEELPDHRVAVASGRGLAGGPLPVGEALDRAVKIASEDRTQAGRLVRCDTLTAELCEVRFDVGRDARGTFIRSERAVTARERTLLGKTTPFVGREKEQQLLRETIATAFDRKKARAAVVLASPGIGKSRLRHEITAWVERSYSELTIWTGRAELLREGSPYGPIADALRAAAGIDDADRESARRARLLARVARYVPPGERLFVAEMLGETMGIPFSDAGREELSAVRRSPRLLGDHVRRAFTTLVSAEAAARPLLLVLEDLHWGDAPTLDLVTSALSHLPNAPFCVIAFARPEVGAKFGELFQSANPLRIDLAPLSRGVCEAYVRAMLGQSVGTAAVARVLDLAAGNALYLEELIRAVAAGELETLPATLVAMSAARVERQSPDARRLLRAASILGETFDIGTVAAILGDRALELESVLHGLVEREVVRPVPASTHARPQHVFAHALFREAAYAMLTPQDRELGHLRAAEHLASETSPHAAALAHHYELGGASRKAAPWLLRASEEALAAGDFRRSIALAERGLKGTQDPEVRGALRGVQAEAHRWVNEGPRAEAASEEALSLLPKGSARWCRAATEYAVAVANRGGREPLLRIEYELCNVPVDSETTPAFLIASARLICGMRGVGVPGDSLYKRFLTFAARESELSALSRAWIHWAQCNLAAGDNDVANFYFGSQRSLAMFERIGDQRNAVIMRITHARARVLIEGAHLAAEEDLVRSVEVARRMDLPRVLLMAGHVSGVAQLRRGAIALAVETFCDVIERYLATGEARLASGVRVELAWALTELGEMERAHVEATQALEAFPLVGPDRNKALLSMAYVFEKRGEPDRALPLLEQALSDFDHGDFEIALRLLHATTLVRLQREKEARAAHATTLTLLNTRAASLRDSALERAYRQDVPENAAAFALGEKLGLKRVP